MRSSENDKPEKSSNYHKKIYFNKNLRIISMRSSENKNRNYAKVRKEKFSFKKNL